MNLVDLKVDGFVKELASDSPAPGGGSVGALAGSLAAGLAAMVGRLTVSKEKFADKHALLAPVVEEGDKLVDEALALIDKDTASFNVLMDAFKLPKGTDEEKAARSEAIQKATVGTIDVPLRTLEVCVRSLQLARIAAEHGNPNAVSDAGTGAQMARAGAVAAAYNVRINCMGLKDKALAAEYLKKVEELMAECTKTLSEVEGLLEKALSE